MKASKLIVLFVVALLVLLLLKLPVSLLASKLPIPKGIAYQGLNGSIWSGSIEKLQVNKWLFEKVSWQTNFASLLTAKLGVDVKFGQPRNSSQISGKGLLQFGLSGLQVSSTTVRIPANEVKPMLPIPVGELGGRIVVEIDSFTKGTQLCEQLTGELIWTQAAIEFGGPVELGAINAKLNCDENAIIANFDGLNRLGLEGSAKIALPNKYNFDGYLKPDADLPQGIHNGLSMFGKADPKGKFKITL